MVQWASRTRERRILLSMPVVVAAAALVVLLAVFSPGAGSPAPGPTPAVADGTAEVIRFWEARVAKDPKDFVALNQLGDAYLRRSRERGDVADLQRAEFALLRSLDLYGVGDYAATAQLAAVYVGMHRFDAALPLAREAIALKPSEAFAYGVLGDALLALGRYDEASDSYAAMLQIAPGLASHARIAGLFEIRGEAAATEQAWRNAVGSQSRRPENSAWARVQLGHFYFQEGDLEQAGDEFQAALQAFPTYVHAEAGLARVEAARGDFDAAAERYQAVVARAPTLSYVVALGDVYTAAGRSSEAQAQYALAEAIGALAEANGVRSDLQLALFWADRGADPAQALARARSAYALRPNIYAADALAWALHRAGRSQEALPYAAEALRLGTRDSLLLFHSGMIHVAAGNTGAAAAALRTALDLNPRFSPLYASEAAATLRSLQASVGAAP